MRIDLADFEAAEDGYAAAAAGAEGETADVEPAQPAESEWSPPGQEWYQQMDQFTQQALPVLQQLGQYIQTQPQQTESEYGEYSPPEYYEGEDPIEYVNQLVESRIQNVLEPFTPILGYVAQREAETATREALSNIEKEVGTFNHDQAVFASLGMQQQGVDPEVALRYAAMRQREFEETLRTEAVEEYKASLAKSEEVAAQPPTATGAASEVEKVPTGPDRYTIMADRWVNDQFS